MAAPVYSEDEYQKIVQALPTRSPIYLPTEKLSLEQRIDGVRKVADIYANRLDQVYKPRLRALREQFAGTKRCFVIGNGPSLNRTDLAALKGEVVFAVNGFFLKYDELDWRPTFYVCEDHLVAEDRADQLNALTGSIKLFPTYLGYCLDETEDTIFFNHQPRKSYPHGFDFSLDAADITYTGCTVTYTSLQLAHYLGFETIYLIGVDANYDLPTDVEQSKKYGTGVLDMKSDDPNHFHPDYFGKGYRWHDPQVDQMLSAYAEAEKVTRATGRLIKNATIGGKLEVFERANFNEVLPHARPPEQVEADRERALKAIKPRPKILLLDMTRMGGGTATGEIKRSLLERWSPSEILQIHSDGEALNVFKDGKSGGEPLDEDAAIREAQDFDADLILYRPTADKPALHRAAMRLIRASKSPLAVWIMDDWMARLTADDPARGAEMDRDLRWLVARAGLKLSISQTMSEMLARRYGGRWLPFANGVAPADWPEQPREDAPETIVLRYAGGLAQDMTLDSLVDLAQAVEALSATHPVRLEINTRPHWQRQAGDRFAGLNAVRLTTHDLSPQAYRRWLSEADVSVIAYNFDPETARYVQYSLANKTPECMASGAAILAYGPEAINTISLLKGYGCAELVTSRDPEALKAGVLKLVDDGQRRRDLGARARTLAFERHGLAQTQAAFEQQLRRLARPRPMQKASKAFARMLARLKLDARTLATAVAAATVVAALVGVGWLLGGLMPALLLGVAAAALLVFVRQVMPRSLDIDPALLTVTAGAPAAGAPSAKADPQLMQRLDKMDETLSEVAAWSNRTRRDLLSTLEARTRAISDKLDGVQGGAPRATTRLAEPAPDLETPAAAPSDLSEQWRGLDWRRTNDSTPIQ